MAMRAWRAGGVTAVALRGNPGCSGHGVVFLQEGSRVYPADADPSLRTDATATPPPGSPSQ